MVTYYAALFGVADLFVIKLVNTVKIHTKMIITVKTLQQETFKVEIEESKLVIIARISFISILVLKLHVIL